MKNQPSNDQYTILQNKSTKFLLIGSLASLVLLITTSLFYPNTLSYSSLLSASSYSTDNKASKKITKIPSSSSSTNKCDIFSGKWVPNPDAPYYTNATCRAIHEHQNCMKYGRPDSDYMRWRWKPDDCELSVFEPIQFLELMRNKSLAFLGDSVSRNQMQSLICLLSRAEYPTDTSKSNTYDELDQSIDFKRWKYTSHNFTLAFFWTPHLVNGRQSKHTGTKKPDLFDLFLDEPDHTWTSHIAEFDHIIISAGHWFFNPKVFYENRTVVGCHRCNLPNIIDLGMFYGYRRALRTAFEAFKSRPEYGGVTYLRTFAPSHFDGGNWYQGGDCTMARPYSVGETTLEYLHLDMYSVQVEEFRAAEITGRRRGLKFQLLNTTYAALLRPDGHPSRYGHAARDNETRYNDCVHWCLPGPIDTWNDFLLEMLKTENDVLRF